MQFYKFRYALDLLPTIESHSLTVKTKKIENEKIISNKHILNKYDDNNNNNKLKE